MSALRTAAAPTAPKQHGGYLCRNSGPSSYLDLFCAVISVLMQAPRTRTELEHAAQIRGKDQAQRYIAATHDKGLIYFTWERGANLQWVRRYHWQHEGPFAHPDDPHPRDLPRAPTPRTRRKAAGAELEVHTRLARDRGPLFDGEDDERLRR